MLFRFCINVKLGNNIWKKYTKSACGTKHAFDINCFDINFLKCRAAKETKPVQPVHGFPWGGGDLTFYPTIRCNSIFHWFRIVEYIPIFFSDRSPIGRFSKWSPNTPFGFKMEPKYEVGLA